MPLSSNHIAISVTRSYIFLIPHSSCSGASSCACASSSSSFVHDGGKS
jgi:hypothetical protein